MKQFRTFSSVPFSPRSYTISKFQRENNKAFKDYKELWNKCFLFQTQL